MGWDEQSRKLSNDDDEDENNENNYGDDEDNDVDENDDDDGDENDDDDVDENGRTDNHGTSYSSLLLLASGCATLPPCQSGPGQRTQTLHYGIILNT